MSKHKYLIFSVIVLLLFAGGLAAVYQFYLKPESEEIKRLEASYATLDKKLSDYEKTFSTVRPEVVVEEWSKILPSWNEAVATRSQYFRLDGTTKVEPIPEGKIARFYYEDEYNRLMQELYQEAFEKGLQVPQVSFNIPPPQSLQNKDVKKEDAEKWLYQLAEGIDTVRLLMDSGAVQILAITFWPSRTESNVLDMRTAGVSMFITLPRFLDFVERVSYDRARYFNIDAFKISNRQLRISGDPYLQVDFLLTQAKYKEGSSPTATMTGTNRLGQRGMMGPYSPMQGRDRTSTTRKVTKKSWWNKLWPF